MDEIKPMADYASQQSDRWLFICALGVLMAFCLVIWRWIVADREKLGARLTEVTDRHIKSVENLGEVVANNTTALKEVKEVMQTCRLKNYP